MGDTITFETEYQRKLRIAVLIYFLGLIAGVVYLSVWNRLSTPVDEGLIFTVVVLFSVLSSSNLLPKDRTVISKRTGGGEINSVGSDMLKTLFTGGLYLPYYLYSRQQKIHHYQESQERLPEMKSTWKDAQNQAREDNLSDGIAVGNDLMDELEVAVSKYTEVNLQEYESLLVTVHQTVLKWRIEKGEKQIDEAKTQASDGEYENAIAILDDVIEEVGSSLIDSFEFTCHDGTFDWDDEEELPDDIANKIKDDVRYRLLVSESGEQADPSTLDDIAKFLTRGYELRLEWMKRSIEQMLSQANNEIENEALAEGVDTARTAKEKADEAMRLYEAAPETTSISSLEQQCQRAYDCTVSYEQQIVQERLDEARTQFDNGQYKTAITLTTEIEDRLVSALEFLSTGPIDIDVTPLEQLRKKATQRFVEYECGRARDQLQTAEDECGSGTPREAVDIVQSVTEQIEEALEHVEAATDDIETTALENLRKETEKRTVEYKLVIAENRLDSSRKTAEKGNYSEARNMAEEVKEQTEDITEFATRAKREIDTAAIEDVRERSIQMIVDYEAKRAKACLESARSEADEANYHDAIDTTGDAKSTLDSLLANDEYASAEFGDMKQTIDRINACRAEWEQQILANKIDSARDHDDPQQIQEKLKSIRQDISKSEYLSETAITHFQYRVGELYLQSGIRMVLTSLEDGAQKLERENYREALDTFDEANEQLSSSIETANEWDIEDVGLLDDIRIIVREHQAQAWAEIIEKKVRKGINQIENESAEAAGETFRDIIDKISTLTEQFDESVLPGRFEELEDVTRKNRKTVKKILSEKDRGTPIVHRPKEIVPSKDRNPVGKDSWDIVPTDLQIEKPTIQDADGIEQSATDLRTGTGGPPSSIPSTTTLDVEYDSITKGEKIGSGGSGEIYEATVKLDTQSYQGALKEPRTEGTLHQDVFDRFINEADIWSDLDENDYIVSVLSYGSTPLPWLFLEYMDSGNLGDYTGEMPLEQALWTGQCIADGVCHAHNHGVAHLDLKPENVLFRRTDSSNWPVPKIGDWGLVRTMLDDQTGIEGVTPAYAAPEQVNPDRFGEPDQSTDIYQLGVVLYELFAGQLPYERNGSDVMPQIVDGDITPLKDVEPDIPPGVNDAVMNAIQIDKSDRYDHVVYLRDRMDEIRGQRIDQI